MDQSFSFADALSLARDDDIDLSASIAALLKVLASDSPDHARAALVAARGAGLDLASIEARPVLMELISRALSWLEREVMVVPTLNVLASLGPEAAMAAFDVLFAALFDDGEVQPEAISDAEVVVLVRLLAELGHLDDALAFLVTARGMRDLARYLPLVHAVRCHMLGLDGSIDALWPPLWPGLDGNPFNPQTWRAMARTCAVITDWKDAIAMLATGATLPVPDATKAGLGDDIAGLAVWLRVRGQTRLIETDMRLCEALRASPAVLAESLTALDDWPDGDADALYDADLRAATRGWLQGFTASAGQPA